jgi:hypothetical protein
VSAQTRALAVCGRAILLFAAGIGLVSCATPPEPTDAALSRTAGRERVILWWSGYADQVENITHVVNDVWVGDRENPGDNNPTHHQDAWLERGIVPLDWAGGRVYANEGVDGLADRWGSAFDNGYLGIAIDEFGSPSAEINRTLNAALLKVREEHPEVPIFVWHGGLIDAETAAVYRRAATMVLLEVYVSGEAFLGLTMGFRLANVRNHDLQHKTVVAISVGEERFADSVGEVEAQVRWTLNNAQDFAGIGFYASRGSEELVMAADRALSAPQVRQRSR